MEIGARVGAWTVEARLGSGGMAAVYRVRHGVLDTVAALKVVTRVDATQQQRLLREGRSQALLDHPNVVRVLDVLEVEGRAALLMEYVEGPTLAQWARQQERTIDEILVVIRHVAAGLGAAHELGIVHRDLKPSNVLLTRSGTARIADFGIAKLLDTMDELETRTGAALGTPAYMAPEQIRSASQVQATADIYALGVMLYELVSGTRPYAATDTFGLHAAILAGSYTPLESLAPQVPEAVVRATSGALRADPAMRPQTIQAFLAVLDGGELADAVPSHTWAEDGWLPSMGRYSPVDTLTDGPWAKSYRATAPDGRQVYVKSLPIGGTPDKTVELLRREANVLRQLHHPALPRYVDHFEEERAGVRTLFVVREWVEGQSLADELEGRRYTEEDVLEVVEEVGKILSYLHSLRPPVIHRDVQPANVIRRPSGELVLVDLGSVRDAIAPTLGGDTVVGTFGYMAPEQFAGDASVATDVHGLGSLAVALLGRVDPRTLMDSERAFRWRQAVDASEPVERMLEQLLAEEPENRPTDVLAAIEEARRGLQVPAVAAIEPTALARVQPTELAPVEPGFQNGLFRGAPLLALVEKRVPGTLRPELQGRVTAALLRTLDLDGRVDVVGDLYRWTGVSSDNDELVRVQVEDRRDGTSVIRAYELSEDRNFEAVVVWSFIGFMVTGFIPICMGFPTLIVSELVAGGVVLGSAGLGWGVSRLWYPRRFEADRARLEGVVDEVARQLADGAVP